MDVDINFQKWHISINDSIFVERHQTLQDLLKQAMISFQEMVNSTRPVKKYFETAGLYSVSS